MNTYEFYIDVEKNQTLEIEANTLEEAKELFTKQQQ